MMHIRELWIDGFGCLRAPQQPFRFDTSRITLFLDDNEAGKTTLQMALLAALYGIETSGHTLRRHDLLHMPRPHEAHWKPVGGPPFGVRLRLHDGTRRLEVRWNFADASGCVVTDLDANRDVTADLCPSGDGRKLGETLLGLAIEEFAKTCLVRQDDLSRVGDAEGLNILVQRSAASQSSDTTVGQAIERLNALLQSYPGKTLKGPGKVDNEIKRLEEQAKTLRSDLDSLRAERQAIADEDAEFQRLAARRRSLREKVARLEYLAQVAECQELAENIEAAKADQARLAELEAEHEQLKELEDFPTDRADQLTEWQTTRRNLLRLAEGKETAILERQRAELEPARHQLSDLGSLANVTEESVSRVERLLGKVQDFEARERDHAEALRREENRLASQGASGEELDRLEERFAVIETEDVSFLDNHERLDAQAATELEKAERDALEATLRIERIQDARQREREAAQRVVLYAACVAGAGLVVGGLLVLLAAIVGGIAILAGLGAGGWLYLASQRRAATASTLQADELAEARQELDDLGRRRDDLLGERHRHKSHLKALAHAFGYEQPEVLLDDFRALDELRKLCASLVQLRAQADGAGGLVSQRQAIEADVDALVAEHSVERPQGTTLTHALQGIQERMAGAARLKQKTENLTRTLEEDRAQCDQKRQAVQELTDRMRHTLAEAGIAADGPIQDALEEFQRRRRLCDRFRQLADELIPQHRSRVVAPDTLATWTADAERVHRAVSTQREERPELLTLQATERSQEYRRQLEEKRAQLEESGCAADQIGKHVIDVIDRCHTEQPELESALARCEADLARAARHKATLELTVRVLGDIGHQVHGQWAEELNRTTGRLLERMAPRLRDFKFDADLCFGVWPHGATQPARSDERSPALSAGTWDQLYLAVRLGLAEFVARRGPSGLLLLDDPFSHFDDRRFERAMRLLGELAAEQHQVVLFSCQRQRYQWLQDRDREWFDAHIARRSITALANT